MHGANIINGPMAFELEVSKARQVMACQAAGITAPRSILASANVQGLNLIVRDNFGATEALYCKPNRGGSGMGVQCVASPAAFRDGAAARLIHIADTATTILQSECSNLAKPCELKERHVFRAEFVSNATGPAFLYLLHIIARPGMMSMCPCDDGKIQGGGPSFEIIEPNTVMTDASWRDFVNAVFTMMQTNEIGIAAVEFKIVNDDPIVFDVNINNNYSELAEGRSGALEGVVATVDLLESRLAAYMDVPAEPDVVAESAESDTAEEHSESAAGELMSTLRIE